MNTNTPELTDDDRALYETFEKARAGSTRPVGTLRGIRAVLDKLRQGGEPAAWRYRANGGPWELFDECPFDGGHPGPNEECKPLYDAPQASAPVAGEAQIEVAKLAEELGDLASDMAYEANQEMDQEKAARAAIIERGERALRRFTGGAPQAIAACPTDVCRAGQQDGVLCANDECDRANRVRPAPQPAEGEVVLPPPPSPYDARGEYIGFARRDVEAYARAAVLADRQQRAVTGEASK
ncbi:hypothetical protein [Bordetella genomosp. 1]|uniref:Uncharacterized protein n=1 Tax=Bordetella genomosp. 1 TaxID=1395607 RepID=A0ABX4EW84_9BORD|nr:hypothetical protein [Bordetella genomosp. 1]OZI58740.1 hypothetical protein CAL27_18845 [Bordetella genomosp. 1]